MITLLPHQRNVGIEGMGGGGVVVLKGSGENTGTLATSWPVGVC